MQINSDLHVHSKYSMATSKSMQPDIMAKESEKKGLDLIATGDALHSKWLGELEDNLTQIDDTGIYQLKDETSNTKFITTTEVEDNQRIHHLILIPSIETAWQMRDEFIVKNMDADGRPKIRMRGTEIMDIARDYNCIIGPAHIFTPWTGIYKSYDRISDCYDNRMADFVELGLSSDTYLADRIDELKNYTFLTNSDSHSPWPHRMGREFNTMEIKNLSFEDVRTSIKDNDIIKNYGFDPRMGKYHETGCIDCYKIFNIHDAQKLNMKCDVCGGVIKKGVKGRIEELATSDVPIHPEDRPEYRYILPLAELLSSIHNKGVMTKYVQSRYERLIELFKTEIDILLNVELDKIEHVDMLLANALKSYRNNTLNVTPGRGGLYGKVVYD
ncbi:TIGR00375 family protein [uncultured Methanosphaera sp.]|uniref:TIGR00375 family protein n=1 Tax=uncultured Methanosphaera sp. TaxID=262501 RepID=UPI0028061081|nr:TIGR00375 family protein [uncultured Methanosphaera sp.]